jgi:hypothetical protein
MGPPLLGQTLALGGVVSRVEPLDAFVAERDAETRGARVRLLAMRTCERAELIGTRAEDPRQPDPCVRACMTLPDAFATRVRVRP